MPGRRHRETERWRSLQKGWRHAGYRSWLATQPSNERLSQGTGLQPPPYPNGNPAQRPKHFWKKNLYL